jgi:nitric oxide reductase subunit B
MRRLWLGLAFVLVVSFGLLLWVGSRIYQQAPPIPDRVDDDRWSGRVRHRRGFGRARTSGDRSAAWSWARSGATAPTSHPTGRADWLHRELVTVLDIWSRESFVWAHPTTASRLVAQAGLQERLTREYRATPTTRQARSRSRPARPRHRGQRRVLHRRCSPTVVTTTPCRAAPSSSPERAHALAAFFFWSAWAAGTDRPGDDDHVHQQLAARAADRQPSDRRRDRVDRGQHPRAARRHRRRSAFWHAAPPKRTSPTELPEDRSDARRTPTPSQLAT